LDVIKANSENERKNLRVGFHRVFVRRFVGSKVDGLTSELLAILLTTSIGVCFYILTYEPTNENVFESFSIFEVEPVEA
jgi:uncharacterized membrane protein